MILKELVKSLDKLFHKELALEWDNSGLLIGDGNSEIGKILVTLDVDDELVEEAVDVEADLVISHHPAIFDDFKTITDSNPESRRALKLITNNIAVYAAHTNYDIMKGGLNDVIADKLGLTDVKPLPGSFRSWHKLVVFVPLASLEDVRKAVCKSGAGSIGDYSCCTFAGRGKGTFIPGKDAHPHIGRSGEFSVVDEARLECIVEGGNLDETVQAVKAAHPYEEPAYDVFKLENSMGKEGPGRIGSPGEPVSFGQYLDVIRKNLGVRDIGWIHRGLENTKNRMIEKVAVAAGSCSSFAKELAGLDFDLLLTGEISYHEGIRISEAGKIAAVLGHGSMEKFAIEGICGILDGFIGKNKLGIEVSGSKRGYWEWRYDIGR